MTTVDERLEYLNNPIKVPPLIGDYTPFYVTIAIFTIFGTFLILLNAICMCCSRNKEYWIDKHTGNRWLFFGPVWTSTPHEQPPLDLSELKDKKIFDAYDLEAQGEAAEYSVTQHEEPILRPQRPLTSHQKPTYQKPTEYVELQKRESEI